MYMYMYMYMYSVILYEFKMWIWGFVAMRSKLTSHEINPLKINSLGN